MIYDAYISECGTFRYWLIREWDASLKYLCVIMLNPSTADHVKDDHTIKKLIEFAKRFGYGGIVVLNLSAYRATKPADLVKAGWPIGAENEFYVTRVVDGGCDVLCAWGSNAAGTLPELEMKALLKKLGAKTYALKINADGTPAHPLMLPYTSQLQEYLL